MTRALIARLASLVVVGCTGAQPTATAHVPTTASPGEVVAWPAADALFRRDDRFLGGDAAVSIDLGADRVLWLFGDSFVAHGKGGGRDRAAFVHNAVALELGRDPSRAGFVFYPRLGEDGTAQPFFADDERGFFWPGHGLVLGSKLFVFLERMQLDATAGGLGFRPAGFALVCIDNPEAEPSRWQPRPVPTPDLPELGLVGVSVLRQDDFVYAYAVRDPGDRALRLVRWSVAEFERGELRHPQLFGGPEAGFGAGPATALASSVASELSVTRSPRGGFLELNSHGFGAASIELRFAAALEGPFGAPVTIFRTPPGWPEDTLLYAARAHEELKGAELVLTYATNSLDHARLMRDLELYFPRFLRGSLAPPSEKPVSP